MFGSNSGLYLGCSDSISFRILGSFDLVPHLFYSIRKITIIQHTLELKLKFSYLVHIGTIGNIQKQIDKQQRAQVNGCHLSQSHQSPVQIHPSVMIMKKKMKLFLFFLNSFLIKEGKQLFFKSYILAIISLKKI